MLGLGLKLIIIFGNLSIFWGDKDRLSIFWGGKDRLSIFRGGKDRLSIFRRGKDRQQLAINNIFEVFHLVSFSVS